MKKIFSLCVLLGIFSIAALADQTPGLSGQMLLNRLYYDRVGALLKKAGGAP